MAIDLGRESADPTLPATAFLQKYCAWRCGSASVPPGDRDRGDYFAMVPAYGCSGSDCLGSADFFSDVALGMLQSPRISEETMARRALVDARYDRDVGPVAQMSSNMYRWEGGGGGEEAIIASRDHLRWASWVITSRVLTVEGSPGSTARNRLLIPLIDMCNHDRDSPHVLTGRAVPGASLKVVAGRDVRAGEAVNIGYGGGVEGNDRFVQDYGFLDAGGSGERRRFIGGGGDDDDGAAAAVVASEGYRIVARRILGRGGGGRASRGRMTAAESERELEALSATTLEEDEVLLASGRVVANDERTALEYRIGVKRAIRLLQAATGTI
jgi:hypothetical protein